MVPRPLFFVSLLLGLALVIQAQAEDGSELSSSIDLRAVSFPIPVSSVVNDQLYQADIKMGVVRQSENIKFTGKLNFVGDPTNKSPEEQSYFDLPEFNVKVKAQNFLFKVGTDIYNWGVIDGFNPLDLLNTKCYFDPIHSRKIGAASLSMNYSGEKLEADFVYTPWARPAMLPGVNSRWLPRQIYISQGTGQLPGAQPGVTGVELLLPGQFNYSYLPRQNLGDPLRGNTALRLQAHLENLELALYGIDGVAPVPVITPVVSGNVLVFAPLQIIQVNSNVQLLLRDYREQTAGFSFVKTLGSWQIKGEGSWTQAGAEAAGYESWSDAGILALEKTWSVGSSASLVTVLQYSSGAHAASVGNDLTSLTDFFNSNWMLGGHFSWRDNDSVSFFYSEDELTESWMADVSYSRRLNDNWNISLGGTTLDGPASSPLGVYASNKSVFADIGWSY